MRAATVLAAGVATATILSGCSQPKERPSFVNATPAERTRAAADALRAGDASKVPHLITMLGSADPADRMVASAALERLTGQTLGYHFADPQPLRSAAIERWRRWYEERGAAGAGIDS